jgi:hypothetical protein
MSVLAIEHTETLRCYYCRRWSRNTLKSRRCVTWRQFNLNFKRKIWENLFHFWGITISSELG